MRRQVIILCGPSTTTTSALARRSGLTVYDRADYPDDETYDRELDIIGHDPDARAVIIGNTSDAATLRTQANATACYHAATDGQLNRSDLPEFPGWQAALGELAASREW